MSGRKLVRPDKVNGLTKSKNGTVATAASIIYATVPYHVWPTASDPGHFVTPRRPDLVFDLSDFIPKVSAPDPAAPAAPPAPSKNRHVKKAPTPPPAPAKKKKR
jgi:hypothetical protein